MGIMYLCDSNACGPNHICEECAHTSNIEHAVNFKCCGEGEYFEKAHDVSKTIVVINCLRPMERDEYDAAYAEFKQQLNNGVILLRTGFELTGIVENNHDNIELFNLSNPKMSPEIFAIKMQDIIDKNEDDLELIHIKQDDLICSLLKTLGYEDGVRIFNNTDKWYA